MDRRQFLKTSTAALTTAGTVAAPWRRAFAQAGPIKIGLLKAMLRKAGLGEDEFARLVEGES